MKNSTVGRISAAIVLGFSVITLSVQAEEGGGAMLHQVVLLP